MIRGRGKLKRWKKIIISCVSRQRCFLLFVFSLFFPFCLISSSVYMTDLISRRCFLGFIKIESRRFGFISFRDIYSVATAIVFTFGWTPVSAFCHHETGLFKSLQLTQLRLSTASAILQLHPPPPSSINHVSSDQFPNKSHRRPANLARAAQWYDTSPTILQGTPEETD